MAPRPFWKGYLRLSLVTCPIQLFPAISEREKIRFHQINKKTGHRIKYCKLDAETGEPVDAEDIVMGYEIRKGQYVKLTEDELEAVAIEGTRDRDRAARQGSSGNNAPLSLRDPQGGGLLRWPAG